LELIRKSSFEVWANRIDIAKGLKKDAEELLNKYGVENNPESERALLQLQEKIDNRVCVGLQYKIDHAIKISTNRIKSGKYKEASLIVEKASKLPEEYPSCEIDRTGLDSVMAMHGPLFDYIYENDSFLNMIGINTFSEIRAQYEKLIEYYETHKLKRYLKAMPDLFLLLKDCNNTVLYSEAIEFYIDQQNYKEAFDYLDLLRINGTSAKVTKQYQKVIGNRICNDKQDIEACVISLTNDNPWFRILIKECLRN
jgi:hypothetical protein